MEAAELSALTIKEILKICRDSGLSIPTSASSRKQNLLDFVAGSVDGKVHEKLQRAAIEKVNSKSMRSGKHPCIEESSHPSRQVRRHIEEFRQVISREDYDSSKFLDLPSESEVKGCYRHFYNATSNNAVRMVVCAICAREVSCLEDEVSTQFLDEIRNADRLVPSVPHAAHDLFDGKLLDPAGVKQENGRLRVNMCRSCRTSLDKRGPMLPPTLSLANNMWIGRIPEELATLTFPEQLLIANLYPRVFVFKLHPKKGYHGDPSQLQRAMRGTVSTYELDLPGITSMLNGNMMPRPPAILASLVSITFIGLGRLPKNWLRQLFRVRRKEVAAALVWLKTNNPKYYGHIEIDANRLQQLPEDDVPIELTSIIRHSSDTGIIEQESAGYVPVEEGDSEDNYNDTSFGGASKSFNFRMKDESVADCLHKIGSYCAFGSDAEDSDDDIHGIPESMEQG